jgi:hypothetical protein
MHLHFILLSFNDKPRVHVLPALLLLLLRGWPFSAIVVVGRRWRTVLRWPIRPVEIVRRRVILPGLGTVQTAHIPMSFTHFIGRSLLSGLQFV